MKRVPGRVIGSLNYPNYTYYTPLVRGGALRMRMAPSIDHVEVEFEDKVPEHAYPIRFNIFLYRLFLQKRPDGKYKMRRKIYAVPREDCSGVTCLPPDDPVSLAHELSLRTSPSIWLSRITGFTSAKTYRWLKNGVPNRELPLVRQALRAIPRLSVLLAGVPSSCPPAKIRTAEGDVFFNYEQLPSGAWEVRRLPVPPESGHWYCLAPGWYAMPVPPGSPVSLKGERKVYAE